MRHFELFAARTQPRRCRRPYDGLDLGDNARGSFGSLFGGGKQRLFVALALLGDPELVLLDELTTGLDPTPGARPGSSPRVRDRAPVLLVTHFMDEAELLCDRVAIMDRGKLVACDTPDELRTLAEKSTLDDAFVTLTGRD